jgi:raffinose/stachyose/melibiose transport system permease protein
MQMTAKRPASGSTFNTIRRTDPVLIALWISLVLVCIIWILPVVFVVFTSLKSSQEIFMGTSYLPPHKIIFENYQRAWDVGNLGRGFANSILISFVKVPLGLLISALAAFAFTRLKFPRREVLFAILIIGTMIPVQVALGPLFRLMLSLGLLNTHVGVILPYIAFGIPYQVFVLKGFFRNIPIELDEAALIDGCSVFGIFWRIFLPLSKPALAALFILDFVVIWNEFSVALVILQSSSSWTIPLSLQAFQGQHSTSYNLLNATIVMSILPVLIVYLMFQRYFVSGLFTGAVKG